MPLFNTSKALVAWSNAQHNIMVLLYYTVGILLLCVILLVWFVDTLLNSCFLPLKWLVCLCRCQLKEQLQFPTEILYTVIMMSMNMMTDDGIMSYDVQYIAHSPGAAWIQPLVHFHQISCQGSSGTLLILSHEIRSGPLHVEPSPSFQLHTVTPAHA